MRLLTDNRVRALANLNRWNGWTRRPFSVLEHSVVGSLALKRRGHSLALQKAFAVHDLHETAFSEITTPNKRKYVKDEYHTAVAEWDQKLLFELDWPSDALDHPLVHVMDEAMRDAESIILHTGSFRARIGDNPGNERHALTRAAISILQEGPMTYTTLFAVFWGIVNNDRF